LIKGILDIAIKFVAEEKALSIKLVAIRVLVKYSRKVSKETQAQLYEQNLEKILDQINFMLDKCEIESIYLPIEAISQFSRINEQSVSKIAPRTTP